jgi:hypothetical protein
VDPFTDAEIDRLFHALADATRRDIVRRILVAEHSVSELPRDYPMSVTAVQKHVAVLAEAAPELPFDPRTRALRPDVWQRWLDWDPVRMAGPLRVRPGVCTAQAGGSGGI